MLLVGKGFSQEWVPVPSRPGLLGFYFVRCRGGLNDKSDDDGNDLPQVLHDWGATHRRLSRNCALLTTALDEWWLLIKEMPPISGCSSVFILKTAKLQLVIPRHEKRWVNFPGSENSCPSINVARIHGNAELRHQGPAPPAEEKVMGWTISRRPLLRRPQKTNHILEQSSGTNNRVKREDVEVSFDPHSKSSRQSTARIVAIAVDEF